MFTGLEGVDSLRHLEEAVQLGMPVLLQNVVENLSASLDAVLSKSVILVGELHFSLNLTCVLLSKKLHSAALLL